MSVYMFYFNILVFYSILVFVKTDHDESYSSGWIPLTSDKIFNQIRGQFIQIPRYPTKDDIRADAIKVVLPELTKVDQITEEVDFIKLEENINTCKKHDYSRCSEKNEKESLNSREINEISTNRSILRQAKKLSENIFNTKTNLILNQDKVNRNNILDAINRKSLSEENGTTEDRKNTYEVTENLKDLLDEQQSKIHVFGYNYNTPKLSKEKTSGLFKVLAKYNIKFNDQLPNYALSRRQKDHNSVKHGNTFQPFQRRTPYSYNSLNHLPVNPLLAVLLSNYGYYLPGLYGMSSNYNNLYGYLASNNIHNNKPFGVYKIFSDTDSSNK